MKTWENLGSGFEIVNSFGWMEHRIGAGKSSKLEAESSKIVTSKK